MIHYDNHLICIFMNINENLQMRAKPLDKLVPQGVIRPTLSTGAFLTDAKWLNGGHINANKSMFLKINPFLVI